MKVWPNSPGHIAGLEPFFDFIIGVNEFRLDVDGDQLKQVTEKNVDKEVQLTVYNSKNQDVRELTMIPTNTWGGKGLLGLSIRYCSFEGASENVWHILNVAPNSPASAAGLQSNLDYIIAADSLPLDERDDLFGLIESHNNSQLKLYVYNVITDVCREVLITPSTEWGGDGCLGCGIGCVSVSHLERSLLLLHMPSSSSSSSSPPHFVCVWGGGGCVVRTRSSETVCMLARSSYQCDPQKNPKIYGNGIYAPIHPKVRLLAQAPEGS